jgi:hypothetical protein
MKKIKLYEEFVGEAYKFYDLFFNSHIDHNPECDILEGHLDKDSLITYGIYIKGPKEGLEFMEYYSGSNYKPTSDKRSNSKLFMVDKIPAKYKAMWEDLKKIYENEYAGSGRVSTRNEALVVEGQFSWMAQDTGRQIGSERENTITVYMFDDKGQKWEEKKYDGYGEFGGKDYYELLAQMNGVENADRQDGIDIAFGKTKTKGKTLFPALVEDPKHFNYKRHDFTVQPDNDPNQSWYQEPEEDDEYDESKVIEATSYDPDDIFFLWDDCVDNGREGIERGHTGSGSSKHELFTFDTEVDGYDKFETELKKLLKKSGWKNEYNQDTLKVYEKEVNLFDEVGPELEALRSKISGLMKKSDDDKWTSALGKALSALSTLDRNLSQADSKLGVVPVNEASTINVPKLSDIDHTRIIKWMSNQFDSNTWDMKKSGKGFEISIDKLSKDEQEDLMAYLKSQNYIKESTITESAMSDIDLLAQEAKDFKSFVKEFKKEYKNMDAGSAKELEAWLQSVYDAAKTNESVITEGDMTKEYDGFVVLDTKTKKSYKFKYIKGSKSVNVENDAIAKLMKSTGESRATFMVHGFVKKGEWDKSEFEVLESRVNEAKDVKSEVIDKLSQFFGVSTGALIKFNFDGKDDVRALTKALNGTDYEGVDNIVRVAVKAAKRDLGIEESKVNEAYGKPAGLTKDETLKVAQKFAEAISKVDGVKCTVNTRTLEEDSFDLDYADEEFAGGSYNIYQNGDVINMAVGATPLYGKKNDSVDAIVKNIKKMR